mmetsp:Transcript_121/g.282  ORF Transcript_121/g.282 Transcript_121/m.282 type:complete len:398 (+) Transcript_121:198-1391(+)
MRLWAASLIMRRGYTAGGSVQKAPKARARRVAETGVYHAMGGILSGVLRTLLPRGGACSSRFAILYYTCMSSCCVLCVYTHDLGVQRYYSQVARVDVRVPEKLPEGARLEGDAAEVRVGDEDPVDLAAAHGAVERALRLVGALGLAEHFLHLVHQLLAPPEEEGGTLRHHLLREGAGDGAGVHGEVAAHVGLQGLGVPHEQDVEALGALRAAEGVAEGGGETEDLLQEDVGDGDGAIPLHGGHLELVDAAHDGVGVGGDVLEVLVEQGAALARVGLYQLPGLGVGVGEEAGGHAPPLRLRHHRHVHGVEVRLDLLQPRRPQGGLGLHLLQDLLELEGEDVGLCRSQVILNEGRNEGLRDLLADGRFRVAVVGVVGVHVPCASWPRGTVLGAKGFARM